MNNKKNNRLPLLYHEMIPLALFYVSALFVFVTGISWSAIALCLILYVVRMWAVTGGYHRYFSHRSFKTSRFFQFILAFLAQTSMEQGVLWWANHHRQHHVYSDTPKDIHSPRQHGFWYAHIAWFYTEPMVQKNYTMVDDLQKYPELVFLDKFHIIPPLLLALFCYWLLGWQGVVVGFVISTLLVHNGSYVINSLTHVYGKQRYVTGDDSRNHWLFALITLGEGWHNNHHFYPSSTRQGFFWWEIDITFYVLKLLSWLGIVWDLKEPPAKLIHNPHFMTSRAVSMSTALVNNTLKLAEVKQQCESIAQAASRNETQGVDETLRQLILRLESLSLKAQELPPSLANLVQQRISHFVSQGKNVLNQSKERLSELQQGFHDYLVDLQQALDKAFVTPPLNETSSNPQ